jgi:hypothetical protein
VSASIVESDRWAAWLWFEDHFATKADAVCWVRSNLIESSPARAAVTVAPVAPGEAPEPVAVSAAATGSGTIDPTWFGWHGFSSSTVAGADPSVRGSAGEPAPGAADGFSSSGRPEHVGRSDPSAPEPQAQGPGTADFRRTRDDGRAQLSKEA